MSAPVLRSAAATARRLRPRLLSTKTLADEESLRKTTAEVASGLKKLKSKMLFQDKLNQALMMINTSAVLYIAYKVSSQSREIQSLRAEALKDEA